jgi:hypothetical protein
MEKSLSITASDSQGNPLGVCPQCGGGLEAGTVAIRASLLSFLLVGWSYENLWFRPPRGERKAVLQSGESRYGWRCEACGFVGIAAPGEDAWTPGQKFFGPRW